MGYYAHETAVVDNGAMIGENTKVWHHAHVRKGAVIGMDCILGKDVYIDADVRIGNRVKLQNRVSVFHGVTIEDDVFVGPHVSFTNDRYPRAFNSNWTCVPTLVKRGASISANSVIICGVTLGEYCMVGAGSVVTHDVPAHILVYGNPAKPHGIVCKCGAPLPRNNTSLEKKHEMVVYRCPNCGETLEVPLAVDLLVSRTESGQEAP